MRARRGPLPFAGSGRIHQDTEFSVPELVGYRIERLMGLVRHDRPDDQPIVVDLLPEGGTWQRFFLDAGIAFWEDWGELADEGDPGVVRFVDYGARERLFGEVIRDVSAKAGPHEYSYVTIKLESGRAIELRLIDEDDMESSKRIAFAVDAIAGSS